MKTYQVLEPIKHNGQKYMPPCDIDLTDEEAQRLIDCEAIVELGDDKQVPIVNLELGKQQADADAAEAAKAQADADAAEKTKAEAEAAKAQADADAAQTNNKDGGDATSPAAENVAGGTDTQAERADGVTIPAPSNDGAGLANAAPVVKETKTPAKPKASKAKAK